MDIDRFNTVTLANSGVEIELNDLRTGKGCGAFVRILGSDSTTFQQLKTERGRAISQRLEETGADQITAAEMDNITAEMLAGCTIGWRGLESKGEPLPFSFEAAKELYRNYPAIRDQINRAVGDRTNFLLA